MDQPLNYVKISNEDVKHIKMGTESLKLMTQSLF